jgi:hypothetical protein
MFPPVVLSYDRGFFVTKLKIMKCYQCNTEAEFARNGRDSRTGIQTFICKNCKKTVYETKLKRFNDMEVKEVKEEKINGTPRKLGMSIEDFRKKHDVDYIVEQALAKLDEKMVYEKSDVIALTGLRAGYPGLSAALENATEYKGRSGGVTYWAHPNTVQELKRQAIMT